jgi:hypothetical protein
MTAPNPMKRLPPTLFLLFWALVHIASALTPYPQGVYEFESCGSNCTLSGSWVVQDNGAADYLVSNGAGTDYAEIQVKGQFLVIYRLVGTGLNSMTVALNGSGTTVGNANTSVDTDYPYIVALTGGTDTIRITGNFVYLDRFIVLAAPPVATATILPSSTPAYTAPPQPTSTPRPTDTPAYTATPQPTWTLAPSITPQPTATPMVGGGGGSDPASVYATVETGQVTRFDYIATAGNVHVANLLTLLFFSLWGMFLLGVLVFVTGKPK